MYKRFDSIYFPTRLDHRGRLYCWPVYLNYQSSELARALLLFAMSGIMTKDNVSNSVYLKALGTNYFGGSISKSNTENKCKWIEKNTYDIINYSNGILLKQAKDKLLFLSFCIEYKKFNEFLDDDNRFEYHTNLPIQLDATCNGFQHLALLSQETKLFEELNLSKRKDKLSGDFYTFLIHKINDKE